MPDIDQVFETTNNQPGPLDGYYPAIEGPEPGELTTRDAADSLIRKREEENPLKDYIDPVQLKDADGTPRDPKAALRQSDLKKLSETLTDYRSKSAEWLSGLAEQAQQAEAETQAPGAAQQQTNQEAQAHEGQTAEAERARALQQAQEARAQAERMQHEGLVQKAILEIQRLALTEFPDIKTQSDLLALKTSDPNRFARYAQLDTAYQQAGGIASQLMQQSATVQQQQWQSFAKEQDKIFEDLHPELKADPQRMAQASRMAVDYLTNELGLTRDDLQQLYSTNRAFRSAAGQKVLYDAAQWREAQRKARDLSDNRKPIPPVQRPGVARERGEDTQRDLASLRGQLDRTGNLRDAAKLLIAKRSVARR